MQRSLVRLIIHGRVQGVGYRWWALSEARRLRLDGWVRNRMDGTVELVAAGAAQVVEQFVEACAQGPAAARVSRVERLAGEDEGFAGFEERPTV